MKHDTITRKNVLSMSNKFERAQFYQKKPPRKLKLIPHVEPGLPDVEFFRVGRNASHEFYLGVAEDGTVYKGAYGDDGKPTGKFDEDGEEIYDYETVWSHWKLDPERFPYLGHY